VAKKKPHKKTLAPPAGYYDTGLDQQQRAATRGLDYLLQDIGKQGERNTVDYGLATGQAPGAADQGVGVAGQYNRSLADLLQARQRGMQDAGRQIQTLNQSYSRLGNSQRQQEAAAGVMGGAEIQAAQKRAANQQQDRSVIDQGVTRFLQDSGTAETRLGQDKTNSLGQLLVNYSRGGEDLQSQGDRAKAENLFYGQDINQLKVQQAKENGWVPETTTGHGGSQHPQTLAPTPKAGPPPRIPKRRKPGRIGVWTHAPYGTY
jgi:hypothetical protein